MELSRIIHPVGQGGFYTESIYDNGKEFLVAYDCGGNSDLFMKRYLSQFIHRKSDGEKMIIDAIFISHLHADHINGLKYLLDNTDVRYLFLPQLTDGMLIESLLYNNIQCLGNNQVLTNFVLEISREDNYGKTRIVRVDVSEEGNGIYIEDDNSVDLTSSNVPSEIKSGTKISFGTPWLYIPYNPIVPSLMDGTFSDYLVKELYLSSRILLDPSKITDLLKEYTIGYLRKVYQKYFGSNHNSYSMTLFSGMCDPYCYKIDAFNSEWKFLNYETLHTLFRDESTNCLYTGDFDTQAHFYDISRFYRPLWHTIRSIQVPHHGSKNNYHHSLYDNAIRGFISVGIRNKYNHPSKDTLIELYHQRCLPILVTEDEYSKYVSHYYI